MGFHVNLGEGNHKIDCSSYTTSDSMEGEAGARQPGWGHTNTVCTAGAPRITNMVESQQRNVAAKSGTSTMYLKMMFYLLEPLHYPVFFLKSSLLSRALGRPVSEAIKSQIGCSH